MNVKGICVVLGSLVSTPVMAVDIPNTFVDGDPAIAAEVNENFNVLATAINAINGAASFDDYFMKPSSDGATVNRNVVVWEPETGNCFVARTWFTNTTGIQVQNASTLVTPETVFVWQMLCGDASNVTYELNYVYAVPAAGFDQAEGVEIREDVDGDKTFDNESSWDYRGATTVNPLANVELRHTSDLYRDASDELVVATSFSTMLASLREPLVVNSMTFDDVAMQQFVGFPRIRFLAKGIGAIYEINPSSGASATGLNSDPLFDQQSNRKVIFYRAEGATPSTQGSLDGTPFVSGDMINQWVQ